MKENSRKLLVALLVLALLASLWGCAAPAPAETSSVESGPSGQLTSEPGPEPTAASKSDPQAIGDDGPEETGEDPAGTADAEDPDNANPDSGPYYYDPEDPDNVNPDLDVGPSDYEREQNNLKAMMEEASIEEMCGQLYLYDGSLVGLTPVLEIYGPVDAMSSDPSYPLHIWCSYQNDAGEVVARRVIYCSVDQKKADGSCSLSPLTFGEWDGGETPLIK